MRIHLQPEGVNFLRNQVKPGSKSSQELVSSDPSQVYPSNQNPKDSMDNLSPEIKDQIRDLYQNYAKSKVGYPSSQLYGLRVNLANSFYDQYENQVLDMILAEPGTEPKKLPTKRSGWRYPNIGTVNRYKYNRIWPGKPPVNRHPVLLLDSDLVIEDPRLVNEAFRVSPKPNSLDSTERDSHKNFPRLSKKGDDFFDQVLKFLGNRYPKVDSDRDAILNYESSRNREDSPNRGERHPLVVIG